MNERIKEIYLNSLDDKQDFCYQKFAKLVIQECIDTVLDCSIEYTTRPQIAQELKEHFGVEE